MCYDVITNYGYTVFPLFVLMGQIGFNAGIAVRLYDAAHKFIGHVPGGLAMATVIGATGFKTICGSSAATAATFASVAIPEMERYGYDKKLSTGIVATVGSLGCHHPSERCSHHLRYSHGTVHRPALSCRHHPGTDHRPVLHGHHLRMGQNQSGHCAQVRAIHVGSEDALPPGGVLDPACLSPGRRRDHAGLFSPPRRQERSAPLPSFFWRS